MKFLLLYLLVALPIGYIFGVEEYEHMYRIEEIEKAPAFVPAQLEEVIRTKSKRNEGFRVRFSYAVNGQTYEVMTSNASEEIAMQYASDEDVQVAYSARNPALGMLKRYYDLRRPGQTMSQAMFAVAVLAILLALPVSLVIAWKLGWFKRKSA